MFMHQFYIDTFAVNNVFFNKSFGFGLTVDGVVETATFCGTGADDVGGTEEVDGTEGAVDGTEVVGFDSNGKLTTWLAFDQFEYLSII